MAYRYATAMTNSNTDPNLNPNTDFSELCTNNTPFTTGNKHTANGVKLQ